MYTVNKYKQTKCTIHSTGSSSDSLLQLQVVGVRMKSEQQRAIHPQVVENTQVPPCLPPGLVSGHLRCHPLHQPGLPPPST